MITEPANAAAAALAQAVSLVRAGRWADAQGLLVRLVAENPREPEALRFLGMLYARQNQLADAESLLRRSLALRPNQPQVQFHLGRVLALAGKADAAIAVLRTALRAQPDLFEARLLLAQLQAQTGMAEHAEKNFRHALRLVPDDAAALCGLSALLLDTNRAAEAETLLQDAAARSALPAAGQAQIAQHLGIALEMQGRHDEALAAFRRALAHDPLNAEAHRELNALLYRQGRSGEFLASYDSALQRVPPAPSSPSAALLLEKGGFLLRTERFEEARACFARVVALAPDQAGPQNGLALALAGLGQFDASIAAHEKSLALQPDDPMTRINLACTLLEVGETARALALTEQALSRRPLDQSVLAVHELALRANADARALEIADYARHVRIFDLEPPPGFSTMADFNAALNAHLDGLHTDLREHIDQTLRGGTQTGTSLLAGDNVLLRALRARIEEAVAAYIAGLEPRDGPLLARRRTGFAFSGSWSSRLHDCGFHTNHVHPSGWISSCYYVAVPDAVADASAKQGWLKFGEPSFKTRLADPVRRAVQPVPGRLVLFPSYMWHGTIPFHAASARTTIAFDAVPR